MPGLEEQHRHFQIGGAKNAGGDVQANFPSNTVSSTKYELWNIVPKNLFEQFQRAANVWFLTVSIFQMLPAELSPTNQYATLFPLSVVLTLTFIKDALEDYARRRDDQFTNNQICTVVDCSGDMEREVRWKDVTVGSYLRLWRDDPIPADIVLLSTSHEDGVAYVDTVQLDGEMSLKPKFALQETMRIQDGSELRRLEGHVDTELPNELVQTFNGTLHLRGYPRGLPIDIKNFILRGSTLRNTAWILGLVVFTGVDTKLAMNSKRTPSKKSRVEIVANKLLLIVFALLCIVAVICAVMSASLRSGNQNFDKKMKWVWPEDDPLEDNKYLAFITFMIGFNNFIPISLYVTTDLVRTFQAKVMERDRSMYHPPTDCYCRVKNSSLNEDLGQVEFILSDKTGTLTENRMLFKACSVGTQNYGSWDDLKGPVDDVVLVPPTHLCKPLDPMLVGGPQPRSKLSPEEELLIEDFFLCLATCHTAIVEALQPEKNRMSSSTNSSFKASMSPVSQPSHGDPLTEEAMRSTFRSSSPDEEALVTAARSYGFFFRRKTANRMVVNVHGEDRVYQILVLNEFSSERKRMSVLVRRVFGDDGEDMSPKLSKEGGGSTAVSEEEDERSFCMLYAKGADNIMFDRLRHTDAETKHRYFSQLKRYSQHGLRTLVCARRRLTEEQAVAFEQKMHEAKTALIHREENMEAVANEMEQDLEIIGVTAIEDKIQEGVPNTIDLLLRAGIKVWMLTGDNMETAINIGLACKLMLPRTQQFLLDGNIPNAKELWNVMDTYYGEIRERLQKRDGYSCSFVVHGSVLYTIMEESNVRLRQLFLSIAVAADSLIACRLAPAQKAALVRLVRNGIVGNPLTLAIGDGGNDVSMIQEAHVGVGIRGLEGQQAANAADFVIGQFRFLQPLLVVHGARNLRRIGMVIAYSFYKNCLLVLPMAFYSVYTGFTGTTLYDSYLLMAFNIITFLPILIVGVFDWHVPASLAQKMPSLYNLGIRGVYWNSHMLIGWLLRGIWHAALIFFTMRELFLKATPPQPDYLAMGSWAYWACIAVVNAILALHMKAWMDWLVLNLIGSVVIFLPWMLIYSQQSIAEVFTPSFNGVGPCLFGTPSTWFGIVFVTGVSTLVDLAINFIHRMFYPTVADVLLEVGNGYVSGIPLGSAWSGNGALPVEVQEYIARLPPPPHRIHEFRPEAGLKVVPINGTLNPPRRVMKGIMPEIVHEISSEQGNAMVVVVPPTLGEKIKDPLLKASKWLKKQQWVEIIGSGGDTVEAMELDAHLQAAMMSGKRKLHHGGSRTSMDDGDNLASQTSMEHSNRKSVETSAEEIALSEAPPPEEVSKDLLYSLLTLRFFSVDKEFAFRQYFSNTAVQLFQKSMLAATAALIIYNVYQLIAYASARTIFRVGMTACILPIGVAGAKLMRSKFFESNAETCIVALVVFVILSKHAYDIFVKSDGILANSYLPVFFTAGTRVPFPKVCLVLLFHVILLLVRYRLLSDVIVLESRYDIMQSGSQLLSEYIVLMLGLASFSVYSAYLLETLMRKDYMVLESLRRSKHQAMEILRNMFPEEVVTHVVNQMKREQNSQNPPGSSSHSLGVRQDRATPVKSHREDRGIVSIVFCDVCDFDTLTDTLQPVELVQLLDLVWALFDKICDRHGVHKIETVGKTYMCAAMPEDPSVRQHDERDARAALETAIGMLEAVQKRALGVGKINKVSVRIGIHTGRALAGVVGSYKPQFALFGDTVNTAARMQSNGENGHVHISSFTYEYIKHDERYTWEPRKTKAKGKGVMDTYLLTKWENVVTKSKSVSKAKSNPKDGDKAGQAATAAAAATATSPAPPPPKAANPEPPSGSPVQPPPLPPPPLPENPAPPTEPKPGEVQPPPPATAAPPAIEATPKTDASPMTASPGGETSMSPQTMGTYTTDAAEVRPKKLALSKRGPTQLMGQMLGLQNSQRKAKHQPGQDVKSVTISFLAFWSCYAVTSMCVLFGRQGGKQMDLVFRFGYLLLTLVAGGVFYFIVVSRSKRGLRSLGASATFSNSIAGTVFVGFISSKVSNSWTYEEVRASSHFWSVFEAFFFATFLMHLCRVHLQGAVPALMCGVVFAATAATLAISAEWELLMESIVYVLIIFSSQILGMMGDPRRSRKDHNAIIDEHKRVNQLLDSMLPCEVLAEMKSGRLSLAYEYEDVTFLYADIVGFTNYCANNTPEQAVHLVTRLFADFDECTVQLGVYKVCTIGDAYLVTNEPRTVQQDKEGDCERVFHMAVRMLQIIVTTREEVQHEGLDMRIGLHCGRFIGGVIGTKPLRFDVWGEDTLIGNSIESNGRPGMICVSQQAKEVMERCNLGGLVYFFNKDIPLKSGRVVKSYMCTRADGKNFAEAY
eukprot:TRINITY_DN22899_c0_g4_i1.p1 TRINITY_DN22899_c0_g4~~TRINITY_DN22899_c0_g4_i1.p1  ORF type:complete len:2368 (+),score=641.18 TRINITY_DN22899_c0_g4_i1:172-7275(+)